MIQRIFLQGTLGFGQTIELEVGFGLTVFTGPSGAGKSVLMEAMMSPFGLGEPNAQLAEAVLCQALRCEDDSFECSDEPVLKVVKKEKARYFLDGQTLSRKSVSAAVRSVVKHIANKDDDDLGAHRMLSTLDAVAAKTMDGFGETLTRYEECFLRNQKLSAKLQELSSDEKKLEDKKAFLRFEIERLTAANLQEGEDEKLEALKKAFGEQQKLQTAIERSAAVSQGREKIASLCALLGRDDAFCNDFFAQLDDLVADAQSRALELEEIDIDSLMRRLDELSAVKKRYGGITEAIEELGLKKEELSVLENAKIHQQEMQQELEQANEELRELASRLHDGRQEAAERLKAALDGWLGQLKLNASEIKIERTDMARMGFDLPRLYIGGTAAEKLSSGEQRRCRLALLAAALDLHDAPKAALFLDEIDANLSGEESAGVAKLLKKLSSAYQIFAISHQPQLTAVADTHFLVVKEDGNSRVTALDEKGRIGEIARIISGENVTSEALKFAEKSLKEAAKC